MLYKEKLYFKYLKNIDEFLGGDKMIIEVDESKFGKMKYSNGHEVEGVWILGMVERSLQRRIFYFLYPLEKMNFKTN